MEVKASRESEPWPVDTTYALGYYRLFGRVLGIWPLESHGFRPKPRMLFVIITQITPAVIFIRNWITKGNCGTITELVDAMSVITATPIAVMKMLLPWIHQQKVSSILISAVHDWSYVEDGESRDIMRRYAYIGKLVFTMQMFGAFLVLIPIILRSLPKYHVPIEDLDNASVFLRNIPIGPQCWLSLEMSLFSYYLYYILICVDLVLLATAYLGGDGFAFGLAMHLCGQFELLYKSLEMMDGDESESTQRKRVTAFTSRHSLLLKLTDNFEATFHMGIFVVLGTNTFIISISEIILIWACRVGDTQIISSMVIRIYMLYIQIFLYSHIGEHLSAQVEQLQVAIYNSPWYRMPPHIVRDMTFIMMRSNHLFHLTAGKIFHMDYANFKKIIKSMFSYFSILRLIFNE